MTKKIKKLKDNESTTDGLGIIIFIKNPVLGRAKTRLAKSVGDEEALRIYKLLLAHTRNICEQVPAKRFLYYADEIWEDEWSKKLFFKYVQNGKDLGDRMSSAFANALSDQNKALIVGSDCSQLQSEHIKNASKKLDEYDIVIGPTFDGGYYLIGMKKHHEHLFKKMEWSVASVYTETISRIEEAGLTYYALPKLSDIDTIEDWENYGLE